MKIGARRFSKVKVADTPEPILVPVSTGKPSIPESIQKKWQNITNLTTRVLGVSSCTVNYFSEQNMSIFTSGNQSSTLFTNNEQLPLGSGLFCETVTGKKQPLIVADALQSEYWKENPLSSRGVRSYFGIPITWEDGELFGTLCIHHTDPFDFSTIANDLLSTFRDGIESDLNNLILSNELNNRVTAQEIFIRETHHRINNHLTLLISYIQLQLSEESDRRDLQDILLDIQNRIRSIAVIHEELCCSSTNRQLPPLDEYISHLCNNLVATVSSTPIAMTYHIDPIELPIERSVLIGMITAELATNSIKHAFTGNNSPEITIAISRTLPDRITFNYNDNGIGLPPDFHRAERSSLGMKLIALQIEQLHGEMKVISDTNGAVFTITIDA